MAATVGVTGGAGGFRGAVL